MAGIVVGLDAARVLTQFLETMVFFITTSDVGTFVVVPVLLIAVGVVASLVPAAQVDPVRGAAGGVGR